MGVAVYPALSVYGKAAFIFGDLPGVVRNLCIFGAIGADGFRCRGWLRILGVSLGLRFQHASTLPGATCNPDAKRVLELHGGFEPAAAAAPPSSKS